MHPMSEDNADLVREETPSSVEELDASPKPDDADVAPADLIDLSTVESRARAIEALLFASGEPVALDRLETVLRLGEQDLREAMVSLRESLAARDASFEVVEVHAAFQLRTREEYKGIIQQLKATKPKRLSPPALETLAIIAYRQPIVKSDIEKLRGVDATPTLKTLLDRKLIRIVGQQPTAGTPALYGTTDEFLKIFGLKALTDLPALRELRALEEDPGESGEGDDTSESSAAEEGIESLHSDDQNGAPDNDQLQVSRAAEDVSDEGEVSDDQHAPIEESDLRHAAND